MLVGRYTDDVIYQRLAPGRNKLRELNPMRAPPNWETFKRLLARAFRKPGHQLEFAYMGEEEDQTEQ
jgi:hypothetical protein